MREDCRQKEAALAAEREAFSALQGERALLFGAKIPMRRSDARQRRCNAAKGRSKKPEAGTRLRSRS